MTDLLTVGRIGRPHGLKGLGHVDGCHLAGTAPVEGVWPSDHFAVVADVDL